MVDVLEEDLLQMPPPPVRQLDVRGLGDELDPVKEHAQTPWHGAAQPRAPPAPGGSRSSTVRSSVSSARNHRASGHEQWNGQWQKRVESWGGIGAVCSLDVSRSVGFPTDLARARFRCRPEASGRTTAVFDRMTVASPAQATRRTRDGRGRRPSRWLILAAVAGILLAGCGRGNTQTATSTAGASANTASHAPATAMDAQSAARLVKSGFGQRDQYVWVTSVVQAVGPEAVGKFVTVQFNVLDASGEILSSTEQVEAFSFQGQKLAVGTQVDLAAAKVKAARVEATLVVGKDVRGPVSSFQVAATTAKIGKDEYGGTVATFHLANAGAAPAKDTRVGVVCLNQAGEIIGGTSEYPDVIPAKGRIRVDATVITTGVPATCDVYPGPGF